MSVAEEAALNDRYVEAVTGTVAALSTQNSSSTSTADSIGGYVGAHSINNDKQEKLEEEAGDESVTLRRFKTGFFSPRLKSHRRKVLEKFVLTNALLGAFILSVLSIYWGATYKRPHYMFKVKVLTVIQDESGTVPTTMSAIIPTLIASVPCTWHIYSRSEFVERFKVSNEQIDDQVIKLVHDEKYWMALNVKANATNSLYDSLTGGSTPFNSTNYFQAVFESGRDPTSLKSSILPAMQDLELIYSEYYQKEYLPQFIANVTNSVIAPERIIAASEIRFDYLDNRPFYDSQLLGPLQVGLIYCLLLTFFQLALFGPLHAEMAQILKPKHMIFYRIGISWITYFFLSLFFCTVSAIFKIDFTRAFGRGGYMVYWMSTWLLMMAVGGANENMISLIITFGPQYLGFWLMTWIVLNISCAFYPIVLNNRFYRYGYAMPIYNGVDIYKVIFLNLSKHKMDVWSPGCVGCTEYSFVALRNENCWCQNAEKGKGGGSCSCSF